jgi:homogentisate 1,2-dioxygenase
VPYYRRVGEVPPKRHTQFRRPDGVLYNEELISQQGFSSSGSLLYHRERPTIIAKAETVSLSAPELTVNGPLQPRMFNTTELPVGGDLVLGRHLVLGNAEVDLNYAAADRDSELYRNALGDEVIFVESGEARLESVFGLLDVSTGDWVVVPSNTTHRWVITAGPVRAVVIESRGHAGPPNRYLTEYGQFLEGAPYCERDLHGPDQPLVVDDAECSVLVRHPGGFTRYVYRHHPFDVVGWDGTVWPYRLNVRDFEPIVGRIHQPPPVHQTFEGPGFVLCSFVPRPFEFGEGSIPVPYNHSNVDSDEVIFYVAGDFMSRKGSGVGQGSITLHPSGFIHGPQPGSVEAAVNQSRTDEVAIMLDTFKPLLLGPAARETEDTQYAWSWARGEDRLQQG